MAGTESPASFEYFLVPAGDSAIILLIPKGGRTVVPGSWGRRNFKAVAAAVRCVRGEGDTRRQVHIDDHRSHANSG
jgi:hypothetical protein